MLGGWRFRWLLCRVVASYGWGVVQALCFSLATTSGGRTSAPVPPSCGELSLRYFAFCLSCYCFVLVLMVTIVYGCAVDLDRDVLFCVWFFGSRRGTLCVGWGTARDKVAMVQHQQPGVRGWVGGVEEEVRCGDHLIPDEVDIAHLKPSSCFCVNAELCMQSGV